MPVIKNANVAIGPPAPPRALRLVYANACPQCFMIVPLANPMEPAHDGEKNWNDPDARWVCRCRYCGWVGVTATTERVGD